MQARQPLHACLDGLGILGPGLDDWPQASAVLAGTVPLLAGRTRIPVPQMLPAAERRRAGAAVWAAIAVGSQALAESGASAADLASVFASSGGEGVNCHEICTALASSDRVISPTRFHNSVHNAPAGYWSIGTGSMATSSVVCAHDGSFSAGLLEAMAQVTTERRPVLLIAYDTNYPEPLLTVRPIPDTFAVALLLSPQPGPKCHGQLRLASESVFTTAPADSLDAGALEAMRSAFPAARVLPLLAALARRLEKEVILDYRHGLQLALGVSQC